MSTTAVPTYLTPEEYITAERKAMIKSEYFSGKIIADSGASLEHNLITVNVVNELYNQLVEHGCRVFGSDMRVGIGSGMSYFYPDVSVVCDTPRFEDDVLDILLNPIVVVEVLSQSTEVYDRGEKFRRYQQLESLQEYILISQERVQVERYQRQVEKWQSQVLTSIEDTMKLVSVNAEIPLHQIYRFVEIND
ncbi:Uma2 family endonuclease [Candidatus Poribacteria bacterium]|nr:Uma2 family endonuclease [Candidatus Poribacteria bacterium]MYB64679.1 Uma2 family endonuclease [Candidatus Poribacteria bacterium]MYF57138.1 Uma2 family endonuclease [Candidatus Poribacteria bacterium]